ncbi:MAG TPA: DUF72 domain-containing protein [Candidatus Saccharimonas sp.]|nr:DUF72 domain-containing protein [Candidatus Saccharimonas sp.]
MHYFVGTSGWSYDNWVGDFYPPKIPQKDWLKLYAEQFDSVEINNTFYRLPTPDAVAQWYQQTPADFTFSVKLSRLITHSKRLKTDESAQQALDHFCQSIAGLKNKLAVVLVQLPANFTANTPQLARFIPAFKTTLAGHKLHARIAIEFRHASWFTSATFELLRTHNVANAWISGAGMPTNFEATADFAYARFHGATQLYKSPYSQKDLQNWATKLAKADITFAYFNNTTASYAIANAKSLQQLLH